MGVSQGLQRLDEETNREREREHHHSDTKSAPVFVSWHFLDIFVSVSVFVFVSVSAFVQRWDEETERATPSTSSPAQFGFLIQNLSLYFD